MARGTCCGMVKAHKLVGIAKDRSCTDILFFLAFLMSFVLAIYIFAVAAAAGADVNRVIRGVDFNGDICGKSSAVKDRELAAWPSLSLYDYKMCVNNCSLTQTDKKFYQGSNLISSRYPSKKFLYYCVPWYDGKVNVNLGVTYTPAANATVLNSFESTDEMLGRLVGDLYLVWPMFIVAAIVSVIAVFCFTFVTKHAVKCMVWMVITMVVLGSAFASYMLFKWAKNIDSEVDPNRQKAVRALAIIFLVITVVFFVVIVALRKQIDIACEVIREASRAINDIKSMMFFPLLPVLMAALFICYWVVEAVFIFSISNKTAQMVPDSLRSSFIDKGLPLNYTRYKFDTAYRAHAAYHLFHGLWVMQFLFYFGYLVIAGAIANWFFSRVDSHGNKIVGPKDDEFSRAPVSASLWRTGRYHMGTVALTSLIIAICQFIRITVHYIEKKVTGDNPNQLQRCVFCMIQCCLKCVQCCLDKINKNALIWTAIWGDGFCVAACSSFQLIWNNLARMAALDLVSEFVFFLGKISISLSVVGIFSIVFKNAEKYEKDLSSPVLPLVIIFIIAYFLSSIFMVLFESTADTIFLCFLVDEAEASNADHVMFSSKALCDLVGKHHASSMQKAHEMKGGKRSEGPSFNQVAPSTEEESLMQKKKTEAPQAGEASNLTGS